jgi:thiol-disulfide isomerase/thioredoxin
MASLVAAFRAELQHVPRLKLASPDASEYDVAMLPLLTVTAVLSLASGPKFIEDDFDRALKNARQAKKMLFVDAWAPWCHSCLYMREHVLSRPAFAAFDKDLVFASIDTEKARNAKFLEKYPIEVWPTLLFIEASTGKVAFRWFGSADERQMEALLVAARASLEHGDGADALLAAKETSEAREVVSLISALYSAKQLDICAKTAAEKLPGVEGASDRIAVVGWGLSCAMGLPPSESKAELVQGFVKTAQTLLEAKGVLADDTSSLYEQLVGERKEANDVEAASALAERWLKFLEAEAERAATPAARAVFDAHRVGAAIAAKQPERALEALNKSEREFPKDYNPPARLALVQRELGKLDEAQASIDRALKRCTEGPRCLRLFELKADLQGRRDDAVGRRKTLEKALAWARRLPKAQISSKRLAALEAQVAAARSK